MSKLYSTLALLFGLMFVLFAGFQYNDPDPWLWMPIYLVPALLCLLIFFKIQVPGLLFLALALAFFAGAFYFWPEEFHGIALNEQFKVHIERARESLGLGLTGLIMLFFYFRK